MKPSFWKIPAVIVLAIGSYMAGTYHPRDGGSGSLGDGGGGKASTSGGGEGIGDNNGQAASKTSRSENPRKNAGPVLGNPFAKGGARAWFLNAAREGWGDDMQGFLSMFQICGTLDEAAARELANELRDMCQQYRDGDAEVKAAIEDNDILEGGLASTVFRLSQLDPLGAIAFLQSAEMPDKDDMFKMVFSNLAKQDPAKLAAELQKLGEKDLGDALEGAMDVLRKKDIEAAIALLEKFPEKQGGRERHRLVGELAAKDPQAAIQTATRLAKSSNDPGVLGTAMEVWAHSDEEAALAWAASYQGPGEVEAKQVMLQRIAEKDPRKAAETMAAMPGGGLNMGEATKSIARHYAKSDLPAARAWVEGLPAGMARTGAEQSLAAVWVESDPLQAAEWIGKLPAGQSRDVSTVRLIGAIRNGYPQEALDWAGSIQNPDQRLAAEKDVYEHWRKADPAAAEAAWSARHGK